MRVDCVAPFVMGNLFEKPFSQIWKEKADEVNRNSKVFEFFDVIDERNNTNSLNTNYVDKEFLL